MELALSIPEIRNHLCLFIHPSDYNSCALVSRAWFESITPWKWHSFTLHKGPIRDAAILFKYKAFIRVLNLGSGGVSSNTYHLFNHLQALRFDDDEFRPYSRKSMEDLIRRNQSSLQSIHVSGYCDDKSIVIEALVNLPSLMHLHYSCLELQMDFMESFMNICTRLVTLSLDNVEFTEETHLMLKDQQFTSLKQLKIDCEYGPCLDLLRACPNLNVLSVYQLDDINTEEFVKVITTHCKQLSAFSFYHNGFEHVGLFEKLALILPPMKCLQVVFLDGLNSELPSSYSRHYETLQAIHMACPSMNDGKDIQTIMSSCPGLRSFEGDIIFAEDIESGSPWVCQRLEHLQVEILVRGDNRRLDSVACAQLSQLKRLRTLNLSMQNHEGRRDYQHRSLSLRLSEGLELLTSLSKLEHFGVGYLRPEWREDWRTEDIEWMIQAWPNLEAIYYCYRNDEMYSRLCTQLGVSKVRKDFPWTDYMDFIDL